VFRSCICTWRRCTGPPLCPEGPLVDDRVARAGLPVATADQQLVSLRSVWTSRTTGFNLRFAGNLRDESRDATNTSPARAGSAQRWAERAFLEDDNQRSRPCHARFRIQSVGLAAPSRPDPGLASSSRGRGWSVAIVRRASTLSPVNLQRRESGALVPGPLLRGGGRRAAGGLQRPATVAGVFTARTLATAGTSGEHSGPSPPLRDSYSSRA
jgi:hypothetical protein